jgi:hypothetical protein
VYQRAESDKKADKTTRRGAAQFVHILYDQITENEIGRTRSLHEMRSHSEDAAEGRGQRSACFL